jgi:drug/metabolite transporter (DMT)-like permease
VENRSHAVWCALASALSFAVMGVFVKLASDVAVLDKVLFRNVVTLLVAFVVVRRNGGPFLGRRRSQPALMARSLLGVGGVVCYFYAIDHLLLADASMLAKLSPFFVAVFAAVFLAEPLSPRIIGALVLGFAGGLLVVKPQLDLAVLPALVGAASAVFAGGAYVLLRYLRDHEPPETVVLHFSLVTVVGLLPFVAPGFRSPTSLEWLWLVGIGCFAATGQLALTAAYRHAPAGPTSLLSYATIVFSAVFGWAFWGEIPDLASAIGGLLILGGAIVAFAPERSRSTAPRPSSSGGDVS